MDGYLGRQEKKLDHNGRSSAIRGPSKKGLRLMSQCAAMSLAASLNTDLVALDPAKAPQICRCFNIYLSNGNSKMDQEKDRKLQELSQKVDFLYDLIVKAHSYAESDPETSLMQARKTAEAICRNIFFTEIGEPGKMTLDALTRKLAEKKLLPAKIMIPLGTIQAYGNFGAHAHSDHDNIDFEYITPCLSALAQLTDWYFTQYLGIQIPSEINLSKLHNPLKKLLINHDQQCKPIPLPKKNRFISSFSEEEYGGGEELATTGFLVFGILTFWIYTVWVYHKILNKHLKVRQQFFANFKTIINSETENQKLLSTIIKKGFQATAWVKYVSCTLNLISLLIICGDLLAHQILGLNFIADKSYKIYIHVGTGAAFLFFFTSCAAFMCWVCSTIKKHEYCELLLAKLITDPKKLKIFQPSGSFAKRWNRTNNWVALFLLLSIPITVSPLLAVIHIYKTLGGSGDNSFIVFGWLAVIFLFAGIFHLSGTKILLNIYNSHLKVESLNRSFDSTRQNC